MAKETKTRAELAAEKAELVIKARDLGMDVAGKNVTQLRNMLEQASLGGDGHQPQPGTPEISGKEKGAEKALVSDGNGHIRTYSKKEHGADFIKNAKEFAGKVEGRTITFE